MSRTIRGPVDPTPDERPLLDVLTAPFFNHRRVVHGLLLVAAIVVVEYTSEQAGAQIDATLNAPVVRTMRRTVDTGVGWGVRAWQITSEAMYAGVATVGDATVGTLASAKSSVTNREMPGWVRSSWVAVRSRLTRHPRTPAPSPRADSERPPNDPR